MAILERFDVRVFDRARPLQIPTLSKTLVIGTTSGKSVQNQYKTYTSQNGVEGDFDVTDNEAILTNSFFAQPNNADQITVVNISRSDFRVADATTGDPGANSGVRYVAEQFGPPGENLTVDLVNSSSDDDDESITITSELTTGSGGTDEITWTQLAPVTEDVSVEIKDPGEKDSNLNVNVTTNRDVNGVFHDIVVSLSTDSGGSIDSSVDEVVTAVNNDTQASALVNASTSDSGTMTTVSETSITTTVEVELADNAGSITTTANQLIQAINNHDEVIHFLTAELDGDSNDGTSTVSEETVTLSRGTSSTPAELSRALGAIRRHEERNGLDPSYFLLSTSHDEVSGDRQELSNAVASRTMYYATSNAEGETPQQIATLASDMANERALILAHREESNRYPEAALIAQWAGTDPGSFTNAYKELNTFGKSGFDTSERNTIISGAPGGSGAFDVENVFGVPITSGSWSTNGEFADLRRNKDWLIINIQAALLFLEINRNIILFDERGFGEIENAIKEVMDTATTMGIVALKSGGQPEYEITMPDPLDVPETNRASRQFKNPGPEVDLRFAGAIEAVTVDVYASA